MTTHWSISILLLDEKGRLFFLYALPAACKSESAFAGRGAGVTGKSLNDICSAASSNMDVTFYDNIYPGSNGARLVITGVYEAN